MKQKILTTILKSIKISEKLDKKNSAYLHQLSLRSIKKSKEYTKGKKVLQINLDNYDRFKEGKFVYKTSLIEENIYVKRNKEIEIYDINLDYLKYVAYNDIKKDKLAKLLYLLVETDEEKIKKIYEGDELLMDVKKEAERIMENFDALLYYDPYELGKEVGMDKGIDIGKNEGLVLVAKNMLNENRPIQEIARLTGLSFKEIEALK